MNRRGNTRERTVRSKQRVTKRLTCAIGGFDVVLGGGLLTGRGYLVKGPPGSGKTVLAAQYCCDQARHGLRCRFVTLLSESHATLLQNLSQFSFFDERLVGKSLYFVSGYEPLLSKGLVGLAGLLRDMLRKQRPSLLVIDSISSILERADSVQEAKTFFREVATVSEIVGCTLVYLSVPLSSPKYVLVEAVLDGSIELSKHTADLRSYRTLEVIKFRGSAHLEGKHVFDVTSDGISIHPRIEARFEAPTLPIGELADRAPFGIPRLDAMLCGGLTAASSTIIAGPSGAGKTILGLQFLSEGARRNEHGVYWGLFETPARLIGKAEGVGIPLREQERAGTIELFWLPLIEHSIDAIANCLLEKLSQRNAQRLFIDGVDAFRACAVFPSRLTQFFAALTNELRGRGITTLLSEELVLFEPKIEVDNIALSAIFENMILLRYVEYHSELRRVLSILKTRESEYDNSIREFRISSRGIEITQPFKHTETILSGYAQSAQRMPTHKALRQRRRR